MDLTLGLTHDCNLDCPYCYAGAKSRAVMDDNTARRALEMAVAHTAAGGKLQLSFFGGEPLLRWDQLCRLTEVAEQLVRAAGVTMKPTVTTNGTLLDEARARWLADHGFAVGVSIDGDRAGHDVLRRLRGGGSSFDAVVAGLRAALPLHRNLEALMVVDPANVAHAADGVRFLFGLGVRCVSLNPNFYTTWSEDAAAEWDRQYTAIADLFVERFRAGHDVYINWLDGKIITGLKGGFSCTDRCDFGQDEIAVAPSGRIYPCERLVGVDTGQYAIGHVATGFDEQPRQALLARRGNVNPECLTCELRHRCMNWCGCINAATTGAIDRASGELCFHERLVIREANLLWSERNPLFLRKYYHDDGRAD
jgi:uncharacterized protein